MESCYVVGMRDKWRDGWSREAHQLSQQHNCLKKKKNKPELKAKELARQEENEAWLVKLTLPRNSASGKREEDGTETTEFIKRRPNAEINVAGISRAHLVEPKNTHLVSAEVPTI